MHSVLANLSVKECAYPTWFPDLFIRQWRYLHMVLEFMGTCKDFKFALIPNVITPRTNWKHTSRETLLSLGCPRPTVHSDFTHTHTYFLFFHPTCALEEFKGFMKKEFVNIASLTAASRVCYNHSVFYYKT